MAYSEYNENTLAKIHWLMDVSDWLHYEDSYSLCQKKLEMHKHKQFYKSRMPEV